MIKRTITFIESDKAEVEIDDGSCLSEVLTIQNSPILFGCRIGICGTCLIEVVETEVVETGAQLHERTEAENEFLEEMLPSRKECRLACQININTNLKIKKLDL